MEVPVKRTLLLAAAATLFGAVAAAAQTADTTTTPHPAPDTAAAHPAPRPAARRPRHHPDEITAEEIAAEHVSNAYQLVQKLHPEWLRQQVGGEVGANPLVVYNGSRMGDVEALRDYKPELITSIRRYSTVEARARFGPAANGGAIVLTGG
jgi:hypothetical protein